MAWHIRQTVGTLACIVVIALTLGQSASAQSLQETLDDVAVTPRIGERLPLDLTFTNSDGRTVTLGKLFRGRPVVITPVYYRCPMLCGLELQGLTRCLRAMESVPGEDFDIITFSIDPTEGPELAAEKKAAYIERYGRPEAASGWHFLTGDEEQVRQLQKAIGFQARYDEKTGEYAHAAALIVATPQGRISHYFYGVEFAPRELRLALVEASAGTLGTVTDHVLLFCYAYDPTTGKYGLAIMNLIRGAGLLTCLTLAFGVCWLLWRERSGAAPPQWLSGAQHELEPSVQGGPR